MNQLQKNFWSREHNFREYTHPVVRHFSTQRVDFLNKFIKAGEVKSILDVGAGEGFSSFYLQEICPEVVAVDSSAKMLGKNPVNKRIIADACFLPFRSDSFDMVCAWEVFHHLDDHTVAAEEIIRVAKRYICIFEVNRDNPVQFLYALLNREHRLAIKFTMKYLIEIFGKKTRIIKHTSTGVIFPNKTPAFIFPFLKNIPFRVPFGISNFIVCEKK